MDVLTALRMRVSCPKLRDPGPTDAELDTLFRCALRAPDHGLLRPWRFVVFRGAARAALGELFVKAERTRNPAVSAEALDKLRRNPLRAPLVIACVAAIVPDHPKVPAVEQIASMAAAVQNLQLAADALGYGAMWRTGPMAADPAVKQALGAKPGDEIVAFLYVGSVDGERRAPEPLSPAGFVTEWPAA
ncbi:MAG: nitroreductase family protein [Pseudomonadota bacterium]